MRSETIKRIFLIRHGESRQNTGETNGSGIFDGDVPLFETGRRQADEAGKFLKRHIAGRQIDMSRSVLRESPYLRTEQTAEKIRRHVCFYRNYRDPRLAERDFGLFDNLACDRWTERDRNATELTAARQESVRGRFYNRMPHGESPFDVFTRVSTFTETIYRDRFRSPVSRHTRNSDQSVPDAAVPL